MAKEGLDLPFWMKIDQWEMIFYNSKPILA